MDSPYATLSRYQSEKSISRGILGRGGHNKPAQSLFFLNYNGSRANASVKFSKLAAEYDARHEKTLNKLIEEIRARVDFIGVDWADEEDDDDNNGGDGAEKKDAAAKRSVRLLDYACGTGVGESAYSPRRHSCVKPITLPSPLCFVCLRGLIVSKQSGSTVFAHRCCLFLSESFTLVDISILIANSLTLFVVSRVSPLQLETRRRIAIPRWEVCNPPFCY